MTKKAITGIVVLCASLVMTLAACAPNLSTEYNEEKIRLMESYEAENATLERGQIVMIGDSIVWLLHDYAEMLEGLKYKVYNRGISGDFSNRMLERLESNVLNLEPKGVSILIGTNDITRLTADETVRNIRSAIERCYTAGVERVWVQSLYPVHYEINKRMVGGRTNEVIKQMNEKLKVACAETGAIYIDMHPVLEDANGKFNADLTYDGLHPNEAGYRVITDVLKGFFSELD